MRGILAAQRFGRLFRMDRNLRGARNIAGVQSVIDEMNGDSGGRCAVIQLPEARRHPPILRDFSFVQIDRALLRYRESPPFQDAGTEHNA